MEQLGGPAALGGVMTSLMLAAWMFGRWQGGMAMAAPPVQTGPEAAKHSAHPPAAFDADPAVARPCHQAAQEELLALIGTDVSLGQLHADVSAYRRTEQILAATVTAELRLGRQAALAEMPCRYIGLSGQPTCPVAAPDQSGCACSACPGTRPPMSQRAVQPPAAAPALTRV